MSVVCGVDSCKQGWIVIAHDLHSDDYSWRLCLSVQEIVSFRPTHQVIAIDIPIGLPDAGPRDCDLKARRLLGHPRGCSVFPAPIQAVLSANSYEGACEKRYRVDGKKMSCQAWSIVKKVKDVDHFLRIKSGHREKFYEVHPEVSFYCLAGERPPLHSKKAALGQDERRKLLEPLFGQHLQSALKERKKLGSEVDDILDAFVAVWTAKRIFLGISKAIPTEWPNDTFGLPMRISA